MRFLNVFYTFVLSSLIFMSAAHAQDTEISEKEYKEQVESLMKKLNPQKGEVSLLNGDVKLSLGEDYYYLDPAASKTVLVDLWGNMDDGEPVLGMVFPSKYTPLDGDGWGATLAYVDDGYVSDEDAASIDFDELLKNMQESTREYNKELKKAGYETMDLVGWAEAPSYDSESHKLYWAKNIHFESEESNTLNYNIRVLGRKGYLELNFISDMSKLSEINDSRDEVLSLTEFTDGNRYADFDSSIDKVAAYGIGALVAGKLAAKAGIFAALFILLKKFGIIIVVAVGALVSKLFRRG